MSSEKISTFQTPKSNHKKTNSLLTIPSNTKEKAQRRLPKSNSTKSQKKDQNQQRSNSTLSKICLSKPRIKPPNNTSSKNIIKKYPADTNEMTQKATKILTKDSQTHIKKIEYSSLNFNDEIVLVQLDHDLKNYFIYDKQGNLQQLKMTNYQIAKTKSYGKVFLENSYATYMALTFDNCYLFIGDSNGCLKQYNVKHHKLEMDYGTIFKSEIFKMVCSYDNDFIFVSEKRGHLKQFDIKHQTLHRYFKQLKKSYIVEMTCSKNSLYIFLADSLGYLKQLSLSYGTLIRDYKRVLGSENVSNIHEEVSIDEDFVKITCMACTEDSTCLFISTNIGSIFQIDIINHRRVRIYDDLFGNHMRIDFMELNNNDAFIFIGNNDGYLMQLAMNNNTENNDINFILKKRNFGKQIESNHQCVKHMTVSGEYIIVYFQGVKNILQNYVIKQYWVFWNLDDENLWDSIDANYNAKKPPAPISNSFLKTKPTQESTAKKDQRMETINSEIKRVTSKSSAKSQSRERNDSYCKQEIKLYKDDYEDKKNEISEQFSILGKKIDSMEVSSSNIKSLKNSFLEKKTDQSLQETNIQQDSNDKNSPPHNYDQKFSIQSNYLQGDMFVTINEKDKLSEPTTINLKPSEKKTNSKKTKFKNESDIQTDFTKETEMIDQIGYSNVNKSNNIDRLHSRLDKLEHIIDGVYSKESNNKKIIDTYNDKINKIESMVVELMVQIEQQNVDLMENISEEQDSLANNSKQNSQVQSSKQNSPVQNSIKYSQAYNENEYVQEDEDSLNNTQSPIKAITHVKTPQIINNSSDFVTLASNKTHGIEISTDKYVTTLEPSDKKILIESNLSKHEKNDGEQHSNFFSGLAKIDLTPRVANINSSLTGTMKMSFDKEEIRYDYTTPLKFDSEQYIDVIQSSNTILPLTGKTDIKKSVDINQANLDHASNLFYQKDNIEDTDNKIDPFVRKDNKPVLLQSNDRTQSQVSSNHSSLYYTENMNKYLLDTASKDNSQQKTNKINEHKSKSIDKKDIEANKIYSHKDLEHKVNEFYASSNDKQKKTQKIEKNKILSEKNQYPNQEENILLDFNIYGHKIPTDDISNSRIDESYFGVNNKVNKVDGSQELHSLKQVTSNADLKHVLKETNLSGQPITFASQSKNEYESESFGGKDFSFKDKRIQIEPSDHTKLKHLGYSKQTSYQTVNMDMGNTSVDKTLSSIYEMNNMENAEFIRLLKKESQMNPQKFQKKPDPIYEVKNEAEPNLSNYYNITSPENYQLNSAEYHMGTSPIKKSEEKMQNIDPVYISIEDDEIKKRLDQIKYMKVHLDNLEIDHLKKLAETRNNMSNQDNDKHFNLTP